MGRKNWGKVAQNEQDVVPQSNEEDWGELRGVVYKK